MLYVYFGNDTIAVRAKALEKLHVLEEKGSSITRVTPENFASGMLTELAEGASLFSDAQAALLDTLSEGGIDMFTEIMDQLDLLEQSANHFVIIEGALKAPERKLLEKFATEVKEISKEKEEKFNTFQMADALLARDKKSLWLLLMEAFRNGSSPEEVIGILFWQLKALRLAERGKDEAETGLKPFVYGKAKRALSKFKPGELDRLSEELLTVYHDGHLGKHDIALALEKWVLTI